MSNLENWLWKGINIVAVFLLIFAVLPLIIFWITSTDNRVLSGSDYGFNIGDSQIQTFENIEKLDKDVYMIYPLSKQGYGPHKLVTYSQEDFSKLESRNEWKLYFEKDNFRNVIRLNFNENNSLEEIYRHNQYFELP